MTFFALTIGLLLFNYTNIYKCAYYFNVINSHLLSFFKTFCYRKIIYKKHKFLIFLAKIGSFLAVFMIFTEKTPKNTKASPKNVTRETILLRFARFTADKYVIDLIRKQSKTMAG